MFSMPGFMIILSLLVSCDSNIGNYSQWIPDYNLCGISRTASTSPNECFQWNRAFIPNLKNGRNVENGEAPWMVSVIPKAYYDNVDSPEKLGSWCGGALIHPYWVLTAAHCLKMDQFDVFRITFDQKNRGSGKYIDSEMVINYPLYSPGSDWAAYDIGLIKLSEPFPSNPNDKYYPSNLICLPEQDFQLPGKPGAINYATAAGYGAGLAPAYQHLQIGPKKIWMSDFDYKHGRVYFGPVDMEQSFCKGDSGSPIWRNYMGRAYIIGVQNKLEAMDRRDGCAKYGEGRASWVAKNEHINWILDTIKNNTQAQSNA